MQRRGAFIADYLQQINELANATIDMYTLSKIWEEN